MLLRGLLRVVTVFMSRFDGSERDKGKGGRRGRVLCGGFWNRDGGARLRRAGCSPVRMDGGVRFGSEAGGEAWVWCVSDVRCGERRCRVGLGLVAFVGRQQKKDAFYLETIVVIDLDPSTRGVRWRTQHRRLDAGQGCYDGWTDRATYIAFFWTLSHRGLPSLDGPCRV